jgi:predicted anti-sigma-YlaC factor YlaD
VSQEHQHLTTEQLSVFIDKQLSAEEQGQVDEHLKQCEQCQLWLKELRQTVRLVHALPQPQLPRSFALSADVLVTPFPSQTEHASPIATTHRARPSRVRTTVKAISTLAAVVGIVFLLSGFLSFSHMAASSATATSSSGSGSSASSASSTSAGVSNQAQQARQAVTPHVMSTAMSTSISQATASFAPQATTSAVPEKRPEPAQNAPSSTAPSVSLFDLSQSSGRIATGIILLILALVGFISLCLQYSRPSTSDHS